MAGAEAGMVVLTALWLMLPAYLSNMLPVVVGGGAPIDLGRRWRDGKRLLGDGKTWRGLLLAPLLAASITFALQWLVDHTAWGQAYGFPGWGAWPTWFVLAYALGLGALTGDALESFVKRRTGRDRGERWFPFDQLDFILGALLFGFLVGPAHFLALFTWPRLLAIVLLTPALHLLVNWLGYKLGLKAVPW
jgi:CDP-2,3-bis-(O-geranylgeranyl)-sn-glycerol synthase